MINEKRTVIIRDVELHWAKLDQPVEPFGTLQWELQIRTDDKDKAQEITEKFFVPMKKVDDDGDTTYWKANLKRKAIKKDGSRNTPPDVVDGNRQALNGAQLGNGSRGNIKLFQYPYDVAGKKGVSSMLSAVQVTDLKVYTPDTSTDFDVIDDAPSNNSDQADF